MQLSREVELIITLLNASNEQSNQVTGGFKNSPSLVNGDAFSSIPRELPKRANQALVGTLRTVLGEWRLSHKLATMQQMG